MHNALLALGKLQAGKELLRLKNRHLAQLVNVQLLRLPLTVQISQRHRQNLRLQARAMAVRARTFHHIFLNFLANKIRISFLITPLQIGNHALPGRVDKFLMMIIVNIFKSHTLLAGAV